MAAGIRKVNVGTALNGALTAQGRTALGGDGALTDPRTYLARGREAVAEVVAATARAVLPDACAA